MITGHVFPQFIIRMNAGNITLAINASGLLTATAS